MDDEGWWPVLNPVAGYYPEGFDRNTIYEFRRGKSGEVASYRLADQPEWFNIANLYYRPLKDSSHAKRDRDAAVERVADADVERAWSALINEMCVIAREARKKRVAIQMLRSLTQSRYR